MIDFEFIRKIRELIWPRRLSDLMANIARLTIMLALLRSRLILQRTFNCGGNDAASTIARQYFLVIDYAAKNNGRGEFEIESATSSQIDQILSLSNNAVLTNGRFSVSRKPYRPDSQLPRHILIVCDTPYRNVPEQIFGEAPPTHAAGYSDGTIRLISTEEYSSLDRESLIPLDELIGPTKP